MKTILVTGGAGFIGGHFIKYILNKYSNYKVVNFDKLTYASNLSNLESIHNDLRYSFVQGDICNKEALETLFSRHQFDWVVNFAAETHVDRSIESSYDFVTSNILGTHNLLELARQFWHLKVDNKLSGYKVGCKFVQISTDEVYGSLGPKGLFNEQSALLPNSPYAASKASADLLVRSYFKTYGLPMNITRSSNNYGEGQFPEKLIPLMILRAKANRRMPIYGDGNQVRDWIHVHDHCAAIDLVMHKGTIGEIYNIGANNEMKNIDIVKSILAGLGRPESLIEFVQDRLGHDYRYAIDSSKIRSKLGWKPIINFDKGIQNLLN